MNYSILSLSELKALAIANNVIPTGDKRAKQSWIDALELVALQSTTAELTDSELTDSEMEAAAVAVDIANGNTDMWAADTEPPVTNCEQIPANPLLGGAIESPDSIGVGHTSTKAGATTVFASLLCILILAIQAILCIGCSFVQIAIKGGFRLWALGFRVQNQASVFVFPQSLIPNT